LRQRTAIDRVEKRKRYPEGVEPLLEPCAAVRTAWQANYVNWYHMPKPEDLEPGD
jgi:hypothetical protein